MTATPPEARAEYNKNPDDPDRAPSVRFEAVRALVVGGSLTAALLLVVAEFTALLEITTGAHRGAIKTIGAGPHHGYALVPIALMAAFLAVGVWRTGSRAALAGIGALGIATLLIALIGDLPDAQTSGVIGNVTTGWVTAKASPSVGLYMETLGAALLIVAAGVGLVLTWPTGRGRRRARSGPAPDAPGAPSIG